MSINLHYGLIESILFSKSDSVNNYLNELTEDDIPFLITSKIIGPLAAHSSNFKKSNDNILLEELKNVIYINFIRNNVILNKIYGIDRVFYQEKIERCWLKGIRDISKELGHISFRKMTDVDIYTNSPEKMREILYTLGFVDGGYSAEGKWVTVTKEERNDLEKNHYELFPLTMEVALPIMEVNIRKSLQDSFRIYKKQDKHFTADIMIDIHHQLTYDLNPKWVLSSETYLPLMDNIDHLWFNLHKAYYEIIKGDSSNIQSLWILIQHIQNNNFSIEDLRNRMETTKFFNDEAVIYLYKLANDDLNQVEKEKLLEHLLQNIENKLIV